MGGWPVRHRFLLSRRIENLVVDSSRIEVNRRSRRAKTDRLGHMPDPESGNPAPRGADLQNVSTNFHFLESIELLASVATKAASALATLTRPQDR